MPDLDLPRAFFRVLCGVELGREDLYELGGLLLPSSSSSSSSSSSCCAGEAVDVVNQMERLGVTDDGSFGELFGGSGLGDGRTRRGGKEWARRVARGVLGGVRGGSEGFYAGFVEVVPAVGIALFEPEELEGLCKGTFK